MTEVAPDHHQVEQARVIADDRAFQPLQLTPLGGGGILRLAHSFGAHVLRRNESIEALSGAVRQPPAFLAELSHVRARHGDSLALENRRRSQHEQPLHVA